MQGSFYNLFQEAQLVGAQLMAQEVRLHAIDGIAESEIFSKYQKSRYLVYIMINDHCQSSP